MAASATAPLVFASASWRLHLLAAAGTALAQACRRRAGALLLLWLALLFEPAAWDVGRMLAAAEGRGAQTVRGVRALQAAIVAVQGQADEQRLQALNRFFNERIAFASDIDTRGEADHWASPVELLARSAGDCEDYATAKYFSLIAAGVPAARLRMVYVRAELGGVVQAHMVLAYYAQAGAEPLILDNLVPDIRPASARRELTPVFSFNGEGLWQGTDGERAGNAVARLSRWRELLAKASAEGFV